MRAGLARAGLTFVLVLGPVAGQRQAVAADTLFVRASIGDDANDGLTPATALRSIGRAAVIAAAGTRVVVGPGVYVEGDIQPNVYGRVQFIADRRGEAVGDPPGDVVVDATGHIAGFQLNDDTLAVTIDGFVIYNASLGIYVKSQSHLARIFNNVVTGNASHGIYIQDSPSAIVFNNLVYKNGEVGILVTGNVEHPRDGSQPGSHHAAVINNTVYANGDRGIHFAGSVVGSTEGLVLNNIVQDNGQMSSGVPGIQVNTVSRPGYLNAGNVSLDRYMSGTPIDVTDLRADALFVDPSGPDLALGGAGYADDDFRLRQTAAGDGEQSVAVDAGAVPVAVLFSDSASTRADSAADAGLADAGYHYANFSSPLVPTAADLRYVPIYVAVDGSDDNAGDTPQAPFRTLRRALRFARSGNRIFVGPGTYAEGDLHPNVKGVGGRELAIQGAVETVIDAQGFLGGFELDEGGSLSLSDLKIGGARATGVRATNEASLSVTRCALCRNCSHAISAKGISKITLQHVVVGDNGGNAIEIVRSGTTSMIDSVVYGSGGKAVQLLDVTAPRVSNNLIYGNASSGLVIAANVTGSARAEVLNNTFYGNGNRGLLLGNGSPLRPSRSATVLRNIFEANRVGLQVNESSLPGYVGDYNLSADPYGPFTPVGTHDIVDAAGLVNPLERDFHLRQVATGDAEQSPAVDGGGVDAAAVGMAEGTTRSDHVVDTGLVDLGFHYPLDELPSCDDVPVVECTDPMDCNGDGRLAVNDLVVGLKIVMGSMAPVECLGMDENEDGNVTLDELLVAVQAALS